MSFAWPWVFLVLPLPWMLRLLGPPSETGLMLRVPHLPEGAFRAHSRHVNAWLASLVWLLLVCAAARPQMPGELLPPPEGIGLVIAFDVSRSMSAVDLQHGKERIARLQAARWVADDFLARRKFASFAPRMSRDDAETLMSGWRRAVRAAISWARDSAD